MQILERIINSRFVQYLESHNLFTPYQSGFCKGRSTLGHLIRLETFIQETFVQYLHMVAVFFDMEKAVDAI